MLEREDINLMVTFESLSAVSAPAIDPLRQGLTEVPLPRPGHAPPHRHHVQRGLPGISCRLPRIEHGPDIKAVPP